MLIELTEGEMIVIRSALREWRTVAPEHIATDGQKLARWREERELYDADRASADNKMTSALAERCPPPVKDVAAEPRTDSGDVVKKTQRRLNRLRQQRDELAAQHKGREQEYTYHGGFSLGHLEGRISVIEEMLEEMSAGQPLVRSAENA